MRRILLGSAILASIAWIAQPPVQPAPSSLAGWPLYDRYCLACHGAAGDGRGPAAAFTAGRPRDLTRAEYAWRTTALGEPPSDDDLRITIQHGAPGTSMHAFDLPRGQLDQLVEVVKAFAPRAFTTRGTAITLAAPPPIDRARGARLWLEKGCGSCHGPDGSGTRSLPSPPYDLTTQPLHRPRPDRDLRRAAALAIATGRPAMPGYAGSIVDADLWALADHVVAIGANAKLAPPGLDAKTIDLDRTGSRIVVGTWPASGDDAVVFGTLLAPQGPPPPQLAPAQASLSAQQCARCHAKQLREWQGSLHSRAASPGLAAQMLGMPAGEALSCLKCHAPLAEQRTDHELRAQGLSCAGCHVRGWTRHGPANVSPTLLALPGYPLTTLPIYERADFCLPCHQLPPRTAVAGRPLLDTYREWLEGPYMARGVQCQHCHMPNREHTFLGIHDADTFRQGIALTASAHVANRAVTVVAELVNAGAGHYLPTTPTPAAWLSIDLLDARGAQISGASSSMRIGRHISFDGERWHEHADTRIPPGGKRTLARAWSGGRTNEATTARITVVVHPDDYYEHLYEQRLAGELSAERRTLYEQALARAKSNRYTAVQRDVAIAPP
ncbi:MAG: c-type cytochrome [Kofleriaceae bacterium]